MRFYKAVREDYTDFRTGRVSYGVGSTVTHPNPHKRDASGYLSVSVEPADCTGMSWPCRLLLVEPVDPWTPEPETLPNKRACHSLRVVGERPAHEALGPNGEHLVALIGRARNLTRDEAERLYTAGDAAWDAAHVAAWDAARVAAWDAAGDAAWDAAWVAAWVAAWRAARDAARRAARALTVRDLIGNTFTQEHYDLLTRPWREVIGPVHPEDVTG